MARNSLGREIPDTWHGKRYDPYRTPGLPHADDGPRRRGRWCGGTRATASSCPRCGRPSSSAGLRDGMTIATHHHLRNGDLLLNLIVRELDAMGLRDICIASSSVHPVHAEIIPAHPQGRHHPLRDAASTA